MFDLRRIPIVRVLLPCFGGSLAGYGFPHSCELSGQWVILLILWMILVALFYRGGGKIGAKGLTFSLLAFSILFMVGFVTGSITRPENPGLPQKEKVMIRGMVTGGPRKGANTWSCDFETERVISRDSAYVIRTNLRVYLSATPDSLPQDNSYWPKEGEVWQFYGQLVPITNSGNPGALDFKAIMKRNSCWYRFFADLDYTPQLVQEPSRKRGWQAKHNLAARIRNAVSGHWNGDGEEVSLIKAVCLGDRSDLSDELKLAYAHAGAMHLLAVSGLHMGLIWWVLNHLFAWMVRLFGREIFRSLTIVAILWIFAFVTGLSSSVSRAATMFTLFTTGRLMYQRMDAINGILVSAFLLIMVDPSRMLDVGFQLSYTAILGIVTLHPPLRRLFTPKNRILSRVWDGALVSIAAQFSTAPLVIFYFHQIPVYSLITSLVTIPLLSLLIAFFVISVPFMAAGIGSDLFNGVLMKLALLINLTVEKVASLPGCVMNELNLRETSLWMWMGILFMVMVVLNHKIILARYLLIGLVSASLCWTALSKYLRDHSSEMIIGHFNHASIVTYRNGTKVDHYCLYGDTTAFTYLEQYNRQNWSRRTFHTRMITLGSHDSVTGMISNCLEMAPGIWFLGNDSMMGWIFFGAMIQNNSIFNTVIAEWQNEFRTDFILLSGNPPPRYIPRKLLNSSSYVILDGSNRNWYLSVIKRIKENIQGEWIDYYTGETGAYMKRW